MDVEATSASEVGASVFLQRFELAALTIQLDYAPKRVDFNSLRQGGVFELIHMFPLEGLHVNLPPVVLHGVDGFDMLGNKILQVWLPEIKWRVPQYLSSVKPIQPLVILGEGVRDLVMVPLLQIRKDGNFAVGVANGLIAFVHKTTRAVVKASVMAFNVTGTALESASDLVQPSNAGMQKSGSLSSSSTSTSTSSSERLLQDTVGHGRTIRRHVTAVPSHGEPRTFWEGLHMASETISESLLIASRNIITMPLKDYRRSGSNRKAVVTAIKAVPSALLRPLAGVARAATEVLSGVNKALDEGPKLDPAVKFK